jgi:NADH-quinone oxidoreductase subunit L
MPFSDTIGTEWAWVIPALSASAFFLVVIFGRLFPGRGAFISISAIFLGFVLFWYVLRGLLDNGPDALSINWLTVGDTKITWGVVIDRLSVTMLGLVTFVALLVQVYSVGYMKGDPRFGWYFAAHSLFAAAMLALVLADNLLFLYISWELVGLGSYLLIGFWYEKRSAAEAAKKAFVTTRIGDVALLVGIILLFKETGTFEISTIFHVVDEGLKAGTISQSTVNIAAVLIFVGAMGKSAQFPFHVWLPDAMEGPTPVSALIHAATMVVAGVYLVARMLPLFELAPDVLVLVAGVGLFTFVFAGTLALVMTDIKRVLAYSTISHLGLMMLALGAFGMAGAIFHLVAHGVSKALLFLGAGSVMHSLDDETDIWKMGGLWRRMPVTAITFAIGAASLAGIAPLSGFFSKDEVLLAVLDNRNPAFLVLALAAVVLSALYMARVTLVVFFGPLKKENEHAHESPPVMTVPLILLAFFALTVGLIAFNWTDAYQGFGSWLLADQPLSEGGEKFHITPWLTVAALVLALAGVALGLLTYSWERISHRAIAQRYAFVHRVLVNKYYVDEAYQWVIDRVVLSFSRFVALFDRIVINDTAVNGSAVSVWLSALRLRYVQTGRMYNYGMAMALGVFGLAVVWWVAPS